MAIATEPSLVDQLYHAKGKAEIVDGKIIYLMPTGGIPALAAFAVAISLHLYVKSHGLDGVVLPDGAGFIVRLPHRQSFSPDVAYYIGPPASMKFFQGAPRFAVEVRSEGDYGPTAEREIADKRHDYFAAGTLVVWDVDLLGEEEIVRKYTIDAPDSPAVFRRGETADAEPAVPGWIMHVNELFE